MVSATPLEAELSSETHADVIPIAPLSQSVITSPADSIHPIVRLRGWLDFLARSRVFAYFSIVALQLKVIWGIWNLKDLPFGDTPNYFVLAQAWHLIGADFIVWSPLYTTFLGSFLSLSSDAYFVVTAHRVVIVIALAVLVLALMRRLVSPGVAWWITTWWVLLPINFNSLYEVHLFFVVLALGLYLVVLNLRGMLARSTGVALLLVIGVLMRNEVLLPLVMFGSIALGFDLWRCYRRRTVKMSRILLTYAVPFLLAVWLCVFFYQRSLFKGPAMQEFLTAKHTRNVCQIYAFNYQQQHPEWTHSPWTECKPLILSTFGKPEITIWEAIRQNPGAMFKYFWWNIKLIPSGLQVLLFNVAAGSVNPDYAAVRFNTPVALLASGLVIGVLAWGGTIFFRNSRPLYEALVRPRVWGWICMASVALVVVLIIIVERPRPSYMFTLGILLMALTGFCVQLVSSRWSWLSRLSWLFPIVAIALVALTPHYYRAPTFGSRPNLEIYRHIRPFQEVINPGVQVIGASAGPELCFYLSRLPNRYCRCTDYWTFRNSTPPGTDLNQALATAKVKFFLANEAIMIDDIGAAFIQSAESNGWQILEQENLPGNRWLLLEKR